MGGNRKTGASSWHLTEMSLALPHEIVKMYAVTLAVTGGMIGGTFILSSFAVFLA